MGFNPINILREKVIDWLRYEPQEKGYLLCDFDRIQYEIRPCDILLIEGHSRASQVIKAITQSSWSHSALYIGRINDMTDPDLRERIKQFYSGPESTQLIIESDLGQGTVVIPIHKYRQHHIRICRPKGISRHDAQEVIRFAVSRLGKEYAVRYVLDLARFLFPWSILPRRWRSSLFEHNVGTPTHEICSSMLAEAFGSVRFPILPLVKESEEKGVQFYQRNSRLFTPRDFDYSPFFEIIKYPIFELSGQMMYNRLPWSDDSTDDIQAANRTPKAVKTKKASPKL